MKDMLPMKSLMLIAIVMFIQGCVLTKVVSVPMRLGGAVISIVPGVGNSVHDAIDSAAESVDEISI